MPKSKTYTEVEVNDLHQFIDIATGMGLPIIVAAKQPGGGVMWRTIGNLKVVKSLLYRLNKMGDNGTL